MFQNVISNPKMFVVIFVCLAFQLRANGFECGTSIHSEGFIIGGTQLRRGDHPWRAALINFNTQSYFCGGTLITKGHLVTAAHCINTKNTQTKLLPQDIGVLLGKYNLNLTVEKGSVTVLVSEIHIHPDWRFHTDNYDADIAVLRFPNEIQFSEHIFPICWPSRGDGGEKQFQGTVVGWGASENKEKRREEIPKELQVRSVDNEACFLGDFKFAIISSNRTFCAGAMNAGPCFGDSGGGLFVRKDSKWIIRGIVSASFVEKNQCDVTKYALYTDILQYADWTREILTGSGIIPSQLDDIIEPVDDVLETHITIECAYADHKIDIAIPVKSLYSCLVDSFDEPQRHSIAHIHGRHRDGHSNQDVEEFFTNNNGKLPSIPMGIGKIFPNLELFFIGQSSLKSVERKNFEGMSKVSSFFLGFNDLVDLPRDAFYELFSVQALFIDNNRIRSLHRDLLVQMPKLKVFIAHNNRIEHLDAGLFRRNLQLTSINLNNNQLKTIGVNFKQLQQIGNVELMQNVCVDSRFGENISIVEFQDLITKNCSK